MSQMHDYRCYILLSIAPRVSVWSNQMMSIEWANPVALGLPVIRMIWPFAAKPAANGVMLTRRAMLRRNIFTRVAYITWFGLWLPISSYPKTARARVGSSLTSYKNTFSCCYVIVCSFSGICQTCYFSNYPTQNMQVLPTYSQTVFLWIVSFLNLLLRHYTIQTGPGLTKWTKADQRRKCFRL